MALLRGFVLIALVGALSLEGPGWAARSTAESTVSAPDWRGSRDAMPSAYSWLTGITPSDTYTVVVVRGMRRAAVIRHLGGVKRRLTAMTPREADRYVFDHATDSTWPRVVQVARRGHAVVVYAPLGVLRNRALAKLSRHSVAAAFFTDVNWDTYVTVAKRGKVVRNFDAGFRPPKKGALRAERGLPWGRKHQNIWATAWALNERLTLTHLSREWFMGPHPTFVAKRGALV